MNPVPTYRLIARDTASKRATYVKDDPRSGVRTYLTFHDDGTIGVRKTQRVDRTLDLNHAQANAFAGYRGKDWVCTARVPLVEWGKLVERCGGTPGAPGGYDDKLMRKLLNDADYRRFKTVPGRI
jgi:hypothetical protein